MEDIYCPECQWNLGPDDKTKECLCCDKLYHDDCYEKHVKKMQEKK